MSSNIFKPAKELTVTHYTDSGSVCIHYDIDHEFIGDLIIKTPWDITKVPPQILSLLGTFAAIFLGQLSLAEEINIDLPSSPQLISLIEPTIRTLYAVRAYRDKVSINLMPSIKITKPVNYWEKCDYKTNLRAVTMWSGGLDSTLAHVLLKDNNYDVYPLHVINANVDAASSELDAVIKLSSILGTHSEQLQFFFDQYFDIATRYSHNARGFPDINSVPHGRELILLPLALIYAANVGASNICFGFENSTWTEQFVFNGETFHRFDTQSEFCNINLQQTIREYISSNVFLFSPIAPITEYRKFKTIVTNYPELAANASFCYWGNSCGLCKKCSLYYIFQRSMGLDVIKFRHNPLRENTTFVQNAIKNWDKPTSRDSNFALAQIVANRDILTGEDTLLDYEHYVYPKIQHLLSQWQEELLAIHDVSLLPSKFKIPV